MNITISTIDQMLADAGLRTYTALCDQLAELAEAAVKDNFRQEAEIHRLEEQIIALVRSQGARLEKMTRSHQRSR